MKEKIIDFFVGLFCWFAENFILVPLMILGLVKELIWPSPYDPNKPLPLDPTVNLNHWL